MIVLYGVADVERSSRTALTIGTFDGVHRGHRLILDELMLHATELQGRSMVITFDPHPQQVLRRHGDTVQVLTTIDERIDLLRDVGIDICLVLRFTAEVASTPWRAFAQMLIDNIGIGHMIFGHDHAFGRDREGNVSTVRDLGREIGFSVTEVGPLVINGETISSTKIRKAILSGNLDTAEEYLGRQYSIQGRVVEGDGRGRQIGIPTANIRPLHDSKLIPGDGVYSVSMHIDGKEHRGMCNIGRRPTFTDDQERTIEVHLFDFEDDIYHKVVTVQFRKFVRSERKFASVDEFLAQLERDRIYCREH